MADLLLTEAELSGLVDNKLLALLSDLGHIMGPLRVTSLYREGDTGVHGTQPVRGVDIRSRDGNIAAEIARRINLSWQYDPKRPELRCAIAHDAGSGMHLHLQVHPRTGLRTAAT